MTDRPLKVLIAEDDDDRMPVFDAVFANDDVTRACNVAAAIGWISTDEFDLVMLDHDLEDPLWVDGARAERTGQDVAHVICLLRPEFRPFVFIHSWNHEGGPEAIAKILYEGGVPFIRRQFGADIGHYVNAYRRDIRRRREATQ